MLTSVNKLISDNFFSEGSSMCTAGGKILPLLATAVKSRVLACLAIKDEVSKL